MSANLTVNFSNRSTTSIPDDNDIWLRLVQEDLGPNADTVTADDILNMYNIVITGQSAKTYKSENCPSRYTETGIGLTLNIYLYVSHLDLPYGIFVSQGFPGQAEVVELDKSFNVVAPLSDSINFDYLISDVELEWLSPSYNERGQIIEHPTYEVYKNKIIFSEPHFAVARFRGKARVIKHAIDIDKEYSVQGYEHGDYGFVSADFSSTVQVNYHDENGEEQTESLDLNIPRCIEDMMNTCYGNPEGPTSGSVIFNGPGSLTKKFIVVYNPCDGRTIKTYWQG